MNKKRPNSPIACSSTSLKLQKITADTRNSLEESVRYEL